MNFLVVGCSYRTAQVALRERLAFATDELAPALQQLVALDDVSEALVLSTCNRVEVWAASTRPRHATGTLASFLSASRQVDREELEGALFKYAGTDALNHIFRVTSSLDAMVVGEPQIMGQVKEAYSAASRSNSVGPFLNRCMHRAFGAAKHVRNETEIALHPVSVSSVAADLAGRVFGDLAGSRVLVIGAGEMAELAVRHLLSGGATDIRVVNRTLAKAQALAVQLGARAHPYDDLRGQLLVADIVITSTGSEQPILGRQLVIEVMRQRKQRPLFLVDIAVPRDVDRDVAKVSNVYLFDIDDLEQVVADNLKERRKEAQQAERILNLEVQHFEQWIVQQDAVPVIKELRRHFSEVVRAEVDRSAHTLQLEHEAQRQTLTRMADAIVNKLLHAPTMELKQHATRSDGLFMARTARHLFHLPGRKADPAGPTPQEPED